VIMHIIIPQMDRSRLSIVEEIVEKCPIVGCFAQTKHPYPP
jgi:hypothetical protein